MRARLSAIVLAIASAAAARSAAEAPAPTIGLDAVWAAPEGFLSAMHRACDALSGGAFGECFAAEMARAGASAPALAFTRRTGNQGYLREYRDTGLVDVACAEYPFRANENSVCFLVNGEPPMIDVDDPSLIQRKALLANTIYAGLASRNPNVAIFPGPRYSELAVIAGGGKHGGQQFGVDYALLDGCHACARLGSLRMEFDFDAAGRFLGTRVSSVRAKRR